METFIPTLKDILGAFLTGYYAATGLNETMVDLISI